MTLPYERVRAVKSTEEFLLNLCNSKNTPKVPKEIRDQARTLLRHYPSNLDMDLVAKREDMQLYISQQVFGTEKTFEDKLHGN